MPLKLGENTASLRTKSDFSYNVAGDVFKAGLATTNLNPLVLAPAALNTALAITAANDLGTATRFPTTCLSRRSLANDTSSTSVINTSGLLIPNHFPTHP